MTEAEWLTSTYPQKMREHLALCGASQRKLGLFAAAACRRASDCFRFPCQHVAIETLERFAEGHAQEVELAEACDKADEINELHPLFQESDESELALDAIYAAARAVTQATSIDPVGLDTLTYFDRLYDTITHVADAAVFWANSSEGVEPSVLGTRITEYQSLASMMRCVFGNPFRPVLADPAWLTSTVLALAGGIYEERAFDRLPILADALQDAGCDNADVLTHCRSDGPHVRGCWVVDLLLGKT